MKRKLTTIMAMDVVGYSRLMERDEEGTLGRLKQARSAIFDPAISEHSGRVVKLIGDGALVEFPSVVGAFHCAVAIQDELSQRNAGIDKNQKIVLRIGMHLGDVIVEDDDIYGDGVNVASRLEQIADPGGVVLSQQVFDQIGTHVSLPIFSMGPQSVKNISRPIETYKVDFGTEKSTDDIVRFGDFELDLALFELRNNGARVPTEPQVFDLLAFLVRNGERTITKEEIFDEIWSGRIVSDAALSSQIKSARRAVGDDGASQHTIRTVHGRGFRFIASTQKPVTPPPNGLALSIPSDMMTVISAKPSVAVLPFENLNRNADENYLADGISEDISTALSKNRWLTVIARNPAFAFRNSTDSIKTIGQKLAANYVVTGSVRKAGQRVRITSQVVDTETEHSVWSERFDRKVEDMFDLQDEITEIVTAQIEAELGLSEQRKAERRPRKNRGAWDLYHLGVSEFYKFTLEGNLKCQDLLRQALELDSEFASAHARLAYAIVLGMVYFDIPAEDSRLNEALKASKRAIELDDQDANSYFTLGRVHLARREYDLAIDALEYALELNPCLAVTYCGLGDSLAYEGRLDEAIEQFEVAIRLSPHDPFRWAFFSYRALAHLFRGEYVEAARWSRKSVQIPNAQYWAHAHLVASLGHLGESEKANTAIAELRMIKPEFDIKFAKEHLFYLKREDQLEIYTSGLRKAGLS
jgi:TolB-like protein/class 3 adenylate cyclase